MSFNALISNTDDHPRNHAVIATNQDFRLSPAYDLTPGLAVSRGRREQARRIVDEMEARVRARWYAVARREGVSEADCATISRGFAYEGFRYALT